MSSPMPVALVPLDQVDLGLVQLLLPGAIRLADCAVALSADAQHLGLGHGHQLLLLPQGGGGQPGEHQSRKQRDR